MPWMYQCAKNEQLPDDEDSSISDECETYDNVSHQVRQ